jgi:peroxiredoxin
MLASEAVNQIRSSFSFKNPNHIMTLIFNAQTEIDVPEAPEYLSAEDANLWRFQYYKSHFFDYMDFSDSRLVRTPILFAKVEQYLNQIVYLQSDSIIDALQFILEKAKASQENYQFLVDYLALKYERANFVGQDAVWVFLVENYMLNGKADWLSQAASDNLSTRLNRVKPWLVGQIPPEMWYPDTSNNREFQEMTSLFFSDAPYTVIFFWEPDCPHCKSELIRLSFMNARKDELGMEIITVSRDPDISKMKKTIAELNLPFINLHGGGGPGVKRREDVWPIDVVPMMFVLDRDKRIVAKRISVSQLEDVIKNHQK